MNWTDLKITVSTKDAETAEAIAQICEIRGDYEAAIACYEKVIAIEKADWHETQGEAIDAPQRSIARLREKLASR